MSFPETVGQVPFITILKLPVVLMRSAPDEKYKSEIFGCLQLCRKYPFGFGLSYHEAQYSELSLDKSQLSAERYTRQYPFRSKNNSDFAGEETVQLYPARPRLVGLSGPIKKNSKGFKSMVRTRGNQKVTFQLRKICCVTSTAIRKHPVMLAHSSHDRQQQSRSADGYIQIRKIRIGRFI